MVRFGMLLYALLEHGTVLSVRDMHNILFYMSVETATRTGQDLNLHFTYRDNDDEIYCTELAMIVYGDERASYLFEDRGFICLAICDGGESVCNYRKLFNIVDLSADPYEGYAEAIDIFRACFSSNAYTQPCEAPWMYITQRFIPVFLSVTFPLLPSYQSIDIQSLAKELMGEKDG